MRNIALRLLYDGTNYHGWQRQKNDITVQETLENALTKILKSETRVLGCGRTDAGVHAKIYCANFKTDGTIPAERLPLALNALLPDDIAVDAATEVEDGFHAVFSCRKKEYTYYIHNSRVRNPFYKNRAYFYPDVLNLDIMQEAASVFLGTHDFKAVRSVGTNVKTTVRTIHWFDINTEGDLIALKICADGFLYNMARAMAGTVIYASLGKLRPEEITGILEKGDRCDAGPTLPPHGLYMTGIWYEGPAGKLFNIETNADE
jgi:tRNA pseudouridine38-40 synthase